MQVSFKDKARALGNYLKVPEHDIAYYKLPGGGKWAFEHDRAAYCVFTKTEAEDEAYFQAMLNLGAIAYEVAKDFLKPGITGDVFDALQDMGDEGLVAIKYLLKDPDDYVKTIIQMYGRETLLAIDGEEGTSGQYFIYKVMA